MSEQLSLDQLRSVLETEHNVVFFPKRQLIVPEIDESCLAELVQSGKLEVARENVVEIQRYLGGEAVGDNWGSNHDERRKWRGGLATRYGDSFLDLCYWNNQFRLGLIGLTRLSIYGLGWCMRDQGLVEEFEGIGDTVSDAIKGYKRIESLDEELFVVHFVEDRSIEALALLV
ncbi:MAG: hypothetical protein HYS86_05255 [Candidatus Chisholmbacteria bacterium]|nr:hypothetical protein [Candidatus Chisholmbacteria bacterium]